MTLDRIAQTYGAAWCEPEVSKRRELLEIAWSKEGRYQDPSADIMGREALVDHIGDVHRQWPGARIELTSEVSTHHDKIYFSWRMITADGATAIEGVDFGTLSPDGRLAQIIGFFGPPGG
ncbi:nuclear transport factor 2 family protein [uncultured Roseobacter sp.]|uniref:nuclear transport factor 2 family protein n=1 Tax=uncultured Roseobacter sp. TaxID=114847 RepID=UPI00261FC529|nr:nuclear transport factor 2 family protein [uncultured Roseobacter sp.]